MPGMHVTLGQLRAFETVARLGSFSRAAKELFVTQPAISKKIRMLQEEVGLPLLEQVGKQIHLTEAGRELLAVCRDWLDVGSRMILSPGGVILCSWLGGPWSPAAARMAHTPQPRFQTLPRTLTMVIRLHKNARATPAVRRELQSVTGSNKALARQYHLHPSTVAKWRRRTDVQDASHCPHHLKTTLSLAQ